MRFSFRGLSLGQTEPPKPFSSIEVKVVHSGQPLQFRASGDPMALIDAERDDDALLHAEDEAIRLAANPTPERELPTGGSLAQLIESLSDGSAPQNDTLA